MGKRREKAAEMPSIVKVAKKTPEEPKTGKATEGIKDALVELIRLLIHRADVIAWLYDGSADMLYFRSPEDDFLRRAKDFSVSSWEDSWAFLWHGDMSG